ncbi:nonselective cation channel [Arthroderma uncinatum]|uniref:nonselective cation channel n=1 Tax=Arthroderma uncinatum TaxID=74035 RepID=UPI00144AB4A3|nr:nonselective cation channel [Arthroderma uncinatum]KAF3490803.1 nonselective cation channel [Arthroderma uncinatum]
MFSSLFRPKRRQRRGIFSPPRSVEQAERNVRDSEADVHSRSEFVSEGDIEEYDVDDDGEEEEYEDVHESEYQAPLLPMFSAPHLASRCETTLTWEQLRSPQVSQFLLKPIQQIIHTRHLSKATLYALMVNCLQFDKEATSNPGISGASRTRVMVCELLAIKLLKEYSMRSLIDALSYDFHPLQGQVTKPSTGTSNGPSWDNNQRSRNLLKDVRISCLEIAIRAQAKRFLAHPLVVQQLEALWAGTIVFYSAADSLHRQPAWDTPSQRQGYGSINVSEPRPNAKDTPGASNKAVSRRTVALYNPRDASLFKLSRLRVPRYRQLLSTLSYAILLCLFLTLLQKRPLDLTGLEMVFWFWSAGFMLDEIVGFNEQGFSLYLMSFWNMFDVGILLLLLVYYVLRLYGAVMPRDQKIYAAGLAYDTLAANAVLLLPRLFSVLDHYRYFSQLLIAFRMMAADLIAVLILIIIACSGFFVAFTFSFGDTNASPSSVAYALFQMVMGFTPAAWTLWDRYNLLGKIILTLFLFICHFLVVTILITVLTNSFMAIVQNAHEEHQFLFAVNTISMVKSDALFSYVAPTNVLAWAIAPLRFVMPFRSFLKLNRTVIKITHFPILFSIYLYERTILRSAAFEPTDLVRGRFNPFKPVTDQERSFEPFTPRNKFRVREPSVATHQKDKALDQVFSRLHDGSTNQGGQRTRVRQRLSTTNVSNWMQNIGDGSSRAPPEVQDRKVVEDLEARRLWAGRSQRRQRNRGLSGRDFTDTTRSFASDPEDFMSVAFDMTDVNRTPKPHLYPQQVVNPSTQTDVEVQGDDELSSDENAGGDSSRDGDSPELKKTQEVIFATDNQLASSVGSPPVLSRPSTARRFSRKNSPTRAPRTPRRHHSRNPSAATILYNPAPPEATQITATGKAPSSPRHGKTKSGTATPIRRRPPPSNLRGAPQAVGTRPRPIPQSITAALSVPDNGVHWSLNNLPSQQRRPLSLTMGLGSDIGDNEALGGGFVGGVPGSFTTQMAYAMGGIQQDRGNDNRDMLSRLVLARMKTLEESFRDVLKEVKDLRHAPGRRERVRPITARRPTNSTGSPKQSVDTQGSGETPRKSSEKRLQPAFEPENEPLSEESSPDFRASSV